MPELAKTILANSSNLKSYYKFTSGALTTDSSGSSNTLTNNNTVAEGTGKFDGGADFELSSSQYFSIADGSQTGLDITGDISVSFWLKVEQLPSTAGSDFTVVAKYNPTGDQRAYWLHFENTDNTLKFFYSADGDFTGITNLTTSSAALGAGDVGNWVHFAVSIDVSARTMRTYKNGAYLPYTLTSGTDTSIVNSTADFTIGARHGGADYIDGILDDVAVFNTVLSADQIKELYEGHIYGELRPNQFGTTVGLWHLNGNSTDFSGNNNHGTDTAITYSAANGKLGQGAGFNGSSSKILVSDSASLDLGVSFTLGLIFNATSTADSVLISKFKAGATDINYYVDIATNKLRFLCDVAGSLKSATDTTTLSTATWYFVSVVLTGGNLLFYINGNLSSTTALTGTPNTNSYVLQIGARLASDGVSYDSFFSGKIDEVMISSTALTANQIRQIYAYQRGLLGRYA